MKRFFTVLLVVLIFLGCVSTDNNGIPAKNTVFINQLGYLPTEDKYFMVEDYTGGFQVLDANETAVYTGAVTLQKLQDKSTGMNVYTGDFSELTASGRYTIVLNNGDASYPFDIGTGIYNHARNLALKSYYFQRSGVELLEEHAGKFKRPAAHVAKSEYHRSSSLTGEKDVSGGWYDAGDYGRYITPASVVLGVMMLAYEQYPEKYAFDDNNIPESGNAVSDFLDEVRFELEWMLKMQYTGEGTFRGALPWMVNSITYMDTLPTDPRCKHVIFDFSSVATADFVAVMANAARNFKNVDSEFADRCLEAALLAWEFVQKNPDYPEGGFKNPGDGIPGGYGQNPEYNVITEDDITWAALELYLTTGDQQYHEKAKAGLQKQTNNWWGGICWADVSALSRLQYAAADESIVDTNLQNRIQKSMNAYCDSLVNTSQKDGFKTVLKPEGYYWGSNANILNNAQILIFAYELSGKKEYRDTALYQLNYILGLNALNFSHVVELGSNFPVNIYNAITHNDDTEGSFPGLMTGGANQNLHDDFTLPKYFNKNTPPALCYIDNNKTWSTNENCIGYNAPLVSVTAYFSE